MYWITKLGISGQRQESSTILPNFKYNIYIYVIYISEIVFCSSMKFTKCQSSPQCRSSKISGSAKMQSDTLYYPNVQPGETTPHIERAWQCRISSNICLISANNPESARQKDLASNRFVGHWHPYLLHYHNKWYSIGITIYLFCPWQLHPNSQQGTGKCGNLSIRVPGPGIASKVPVRDFKESKYLKVVGFIVVVLGWNSPTWGKNTVYKSKMMGKSSLWILWTSCLMNNVLELEVPIYSILMEMWGDPHSYRHPYKSVFFGGIPRVGIPTLVSASLLAPRKCGPGLAQTIACLA